MASTGRKDVTIEFSGHDGSDGSGTLSIRTGHDVEVQFLGEENISTKTFRSNSGTEIKIIFPAGSRGKLSLSLANNVVIRGPQSFTSEVNDDGPLGYAANEDCPDSLTSYKCFGVDNLNSKNGDHKWNDGSVHGVVNADGSYSLISDSHSAFHEKSNKSKEQPDVLSLHTDKSLEVVALADSGNQNHSITPDSQYLDDGTVHGVINADGSFGLVFGDHENGNGLDTDTEDDGKVHGVVHMDGTYSLISENNFGLDPESANIPSLPSAFECEAVSPVSDGFAIPPDSIVAASGPPRFELKVANTGGEHGHKVINTGGTQSLQYDKELYDHCKQERGQSSSKKENFQNSAAVVAHVIATPTKRASATKLKSKTGTRKAEKGGLMGAASGSKEHTMSTNRRRSPIPKAPDSPTPLSTRRSLRNIRATGSLSSSPMRVAPGLSEPSLIERPKKEAQPLLNRREKLVGHFMSNNNTIKKPNEYEHKASSKGYCSPKGLFKAAVESKKELALRSAPRQQSGNLGTKLSPASSDALAGSSHAESVHRDTDA